MPHCSVRLSLAAAIAAALLAVTSVGAAADDSQIGSDDSNLHPSSKRFSGEAPHPGARTVRHWTGQTVNPANHLTYSYDIVGTDPRSGHAATVGVDIIPLNVNVGGRVFNGTDIVPAILASPLFQRGDYTSTTSAT